MSKHVADRHYEILTSHERFALILEAMARRDDGEADRLEDTCPRFLYRAEDQAFRDRMRRAYGIASRVCLNMRAGLAQLRMARLFHEQSDCFAGPVARLAHLVFLHGREYGKWEAGAIECIALPDRAVLDREVAEDAALRRQLDDVTELAGDTLGAVASNLVAATAQAHASDLLSQWEGFARFCRDSLDVEPPKLMGAFGLEPRDPGVEVREKHPDATADPRVVCDWAGCWTRSWNRRFTSP